MEVIHVYPSLNDLPKLGKRVAPFRQAGLVRRQVAGDDIGTTRYEGPEIITSAQVGRRIDLLCPAKNRWEKEWVSRRRVLGFRASAVATVAVGHGIDQIAA
jgi:hypothetical protein